MLWSWYVTLTNIQWRMCDMLWSWYVMCDMLWSWYVTLTSIQWKDVRHVVKLIRYFDQHSKKGCATCCEVDTLLWPAFNERMCDMLWSWYVTLTSIQWKDVRHVVKLIRYFDQHSMKGCATCCEVDTLLLSSVVMSCVGVMSRGIGLRKLANLFWITAIVLNS